MGAPRAGQLEYNRDVLPILRAHCFQCHGAQAPAAGLRLDDRASALKGGASGPAILPGNGAGSLLMHRVEGLDGKPRMPLGFTPLSAAEIATLKAWIDQGALWRGGDVRHWAYVPPRRPAVPGLRSSWPRNAIDRFVLAKLQQVGLKPSREASQTTLIRRLSLDLIGLPPTPEEVDSFVHDKSPQAYERLVDRLLASPHFGERWATPWLDLARYADSNGYEKDNLRSMWPYRDWVINALNEDMPYDRFTIEQIAGDMLPNATEEDRVASGFNRNTMFNEEGGVDPQEQRWLTIVDRVDTTSTVFLGSTLRCAQCHDHKYDPFTQKDYYRFFAFFNNCSEPTLTLPSPEADHLRAEIASLQNEASAGGAASEGSRVQLAAYQKQLASLTAATTLVFQENPAPSTAETHMRIRGAYLSKGELVTAGTPAALNPFPAGLPHNRLGLAYWLVDPKNPLTARVEVNRLWEQLFGRGIVETSEDFGTQGSPPSDQKLLDWLTVEFTHPTPGGIRPWSVKHIIRLIVTSATYRQSSRETPLMRERDPENRLLARGPRFRMPAEMIRDNALAVSGLLCPRIGGPSVFPYQPPGIWDIPYNGAKWVESLGPDRYRRGLYTFWRRSAPYPAFVNFGATSREFCTVRRARSNTPLQALTTLNEVEFMDAARALGGRMEAHPGSPAVQVSYGFRLCVARAPEPRELSVLTALYQRELQRYRSDSADAARLTGFNAGAPDIAARAAWTVVANVLLNMDETLTKE